MKECFKCHLVLPLGDFYKHSQMGDGHLNKCKACTKKDVKERYDKYPEKMKAYELSRRDLTHRVQARRDYAETDAAKLAAARSCKAWRRRNVIKMGASTMVNNALRNGSLIKPLTCSMCSVKPNNIHGHHDDYAKPLVVRWLCSKCHTDWHKENGGGLNG